MLLSHYRDIAWALECFPEAVAQELEEPFNKLDTLLDRMDAEAGMGQPEAGIPVESLRKSRLLLDRINEALTVLKKKARQRPPAVRADLSHLHRPEKLSHTDLLFRLDLSSGSITGCGRRLFPSSPSGCGRCREEELGRLVGLVEALGM